MAFICSFRTAFLSLHSRPNILCSLSIIVDFPLWSFILFHSPSLSFALFFLNSSVHLQPHRFSMFASLIPIYKLIWSLGPVVAIIIIIVAVIPMHILESAEFFNSTNLLFRFTCIVFPVQPRCSFHCEYLIRSAQYDYWFYCQFLFRCFTLAPRFDR